MFGSPVVLFLFRNHTQKVKLGTYWSKSTSLQRGVPQGSVLSIYLFDINLQPLRELVQSHNIIFYTYAAKYFFGLIL